MAERSPLRTVARLLDEMWFHTHQDYRAQVGLVRYVLVRRGRALVWVETWELTHEEVRSRLPRPG
jgi:hypothetical protein